ncbi:HNH endonuclease signature motif containing protein [Microbacterium capsulatum]|uniref:HNH endonuclease signature motif containing protein n=1 Tax=Microbacterium capsulatum TaxID=3041921 RepID=A0ABU0XGV2_9MICO|nr:HNH endonuclease signature motif containing protein [Microbacterium sp. ASV81]MDQ4213798.1 HNH endonuclease signature motif containing protein [Microbacterium sp. ASV81]
MRRASIAFDDEGGAFVESLFAAALRPRRGGPRFVDPDEKTRGADLAEDPRTNDQLAYDLLLDLIRAGTLAEPDAVFGTRQAGLRLIQIIDRDGVPGRVTLTEDGLTALPAAVAARHRCETGAVTVTVDGRGNPLNVGRESRVFTARQRVALAIRDGGCRWTGCDRPASYGEAHHIDEWQRDRGRTDIDRGVLLCRYHHLQLHRGGWTITRDGTRDFVLHDPTGHAHVLRARLPLRYLWGQIDPPPRRFRPAA